MQLKLLLFGLLTSSTMVDGRNVVTPGQRFKVTGEIHKRGGVWDEEWKNRPSHDENGEPLFHIQNPDTHQQDVLKEYDVSPPHVPGSGEVKEEDIATDDGPKKGKALLRTELQVNPDVSIFAGYARDYESMESRFNSKRAFTVVMAPSDSAMAMLHKKPWEFPEEIDSSIPEPEKERIMRKNILWFLLSHLHFGEIEESAIIGGKHRFSLRTETDVGLLVDANDDHLIIRTEAGDAIKVTEAIPVENGVIWILDQTLIVP